METFSDERLIGGFYVLQYLLQHSLYCDKTTKFGRYHIQEYHNLIDHLQYRNYKIVKNESNTSNSFDFNLIIRLHEVVINKDGERLLPSKLIEEKAAQMLRNLSIYSTDSYVN